MNEETKSIGTRARRRREDSRIISIDVCLIICNRPCQQDSFPILHVNNPLPTICGLDWTHLYVLAIRYDSFYNDDLCADIISSYVCLARYWSCWT